MTPVAGPFWPQGHNLNKLDKGILDDDATYQNFKALCLVASDKNSFSCFPCLNLCKTCDLEAGSFFDHRGII